MKSIQRSRMTSLLAGLVMLAGCTALPGPGAWAAESLRLAQQDPSMDDQGDPGDPGDTSALLLRVTRMESQIRGLTGRIEELQHQNEQLQDSLRKFSQDVDFRFQDLQGHGAVPSVQPRPAPVQRRGDASTEPALEPVPPAAAPAVVAAAPASPGVYVPLKPTRSGDAFDPSADPGAPGAPKVLGTTTPSQPLAARDTRTDPAPRAPLDLMRPGSQAGQTGSDAISDAGVSIIAAPPAARPLPNSASVASLTPGGTREEFDADLGLYKQGQYDGAATGFQSFVEKYPRDRLVPDAVYLLGESYSRLGRHREAAEQFLKMSTDYAKSPRAADALLRLGMSLDALGAKEQACATFQEVNRKFPAASADVRSGVDRELKRAHCRADG